MARPEARSLTWGVASSPVIGKEHVFVGTLDGSIYAFELEPDTR